MTHGKVSRLVPILAPMVVFGVGSVVAGLITACSPASPKLLQRPRPEELHKNTSSATFNPKVDVLFVIDDSGSMMDHQANLSTNVGKFSKGMIANAILDYHIGVTTTSVGYYSSGPGSNGTLYGNPKWVEKTTPDGMLALASNLLVGIGGSGEEMMLEPLIKAFSKENLEGPNSGFYRPEAELAVIFITDAEDQSQTSPQKVFDTILQLKGGERTKIIFYAVYIPTSNTIASCPRDSSYTMPTRLEEFLTISNAMTFNICDPDYGQRLAQLGDDLARRVGKTILLDRVPDLKTLKVKFGTQEIPQDSLAGWAFNPAKNAIVLGPDLVWTEQPVGTQLDVQFEAIDLNEGPK